MVAFIRGDGTVVAFATRPFRRPSKIATNGNPVSVHCTLTHDEVEFMKEIADGYGFTAIAHGHTCSITTVHRTIRRIAQKMTRC